MNVYDDVVLLKLTHSAKYYIDSIEQSQISQTVRAMESHSIGCGGSRFEWIFQKE